MKMIYLTTLILLTVLFCPGCGVMMADGPNSNEVRQQVLNKPTDIQLIDVNASITNQLIQHNKLPLFSDLFNLKKEIYPSVGPGDVLDFSVWETPPATLFAVATINFNGNSASNVMNLPPLMVSNKGSIYFPFIGEIRVSGLNLQQIQRLIQKKLKGKANNPQILVRLSQNMNSNVTILGDVGSSLRLPLTTGNERLLDALTTAQVKLPISKAMIQLTRGNKVYSMPLKTIIRDFKQNIYLYPGDIITALAQSGSFTVLGAMNRNEEISLEAEGTTLAQALGRAGGLEDNRADAKGVFIFRFEESKALNWSQKSIRQTGDGLVPIIYRLDFKNPRSFFIAQRFPIKDKDIIYVSNAPIVEIQKFINIIVSATAPVFYVTQMTKR